ncbi:MAG: GT4 family glycosyltransferase PelF [Candidatus Latescibacterota bacterium]
MERNGLSGVSILHVITRLDRGGSSGVVLDLAQSFRARGARVGIAVGPTNEPQEDLETFARETGVVFIPISHLVRKVSPFSDICALHELKSYIRLFRPVIVHTHTSKAGILGRLAARAAGVRRIVHTPHGHIFYGYFGPLKTRLFIQAERLAAAVTGRIVTLTRKGMSDHLNMGIGRPEQYRIIPSGIDVARYMSADRSIVREETGCGASRVVGWAGRLTPVKNCAAFLHAAAEISRREPDTRFLIAGDGEERDMLHGLARSLGLGQKVTFLGDRRDMPEVLAAMDVFVLSSRNEGFGRVLVEAMASGAPVVSTDVGGAAEVLGEGNAGLLVTSGEPGELASAVIQILGDDALHDHLRAAGRRRAADFDIRVTVDAYEKVYLELLGS